jgi:hypothetical protein
LKPSAALRQQAITERHILNKHMETRGNKKEPGGTIDSWCGKCKMVLAHTIEAMVGDKPARVQCNTCRSQHSYKASEPSSTRRPARAREAGDSPAPTPKTRSTRYQTLLKGKDMAVAKNYSTKDRYEPGDVVQHPSFGFGVTTAVKDGTKIEVLFESGLKVLVHGR